MRKISWLLDYLVCPLFTATCSNKLELTARKLQCGCGAVYGGYPELLGLRPVDDCRLPPPLLAGKYQETMFVNMFALRQYGPLLDLDKSSKIRPVINIRSGSENFYQTLLALVSPYANQASLIVDIGCGTGRLAGELARQFESARVIGLDESPEMVARAKQIVCSARDSYVKFTVRTSKIGSVGASLAGWGRDNCDFLVADGQSAPILGVAADIVACVNVFHRVSRPNSLLCSVQRILKPGGIFLVSNSYDWKEEFTPRERWFDRFDSLLNMAEWHKLSEIDGVTFITPTYDRKYDLTVNHIEVFKRMV